MLRVTANNPCNPSRNKMCKAGHACIEIEIGGVLGDYCMPLGTLGQACSADGQCYSGNCNQTAGECQPTVACE